MSRFTGEALSRSQQRCAIGAIALVCALCALALARNDSRAQTAAGDGCSPNCVIVIQVEGLEPKDVTPATTPYLWGLAHPQAGGVSSPGGALENRSGWIWQAPRGAMSTGTAPATASLLTGAYPDRSGVPSDHFYDPTGDGHQRLGAGGFGDQDLAGDPTQGADPAGAPAVPIGSARVDTVVEALANAGGRAAVFLGDPALAGISHAKTDAAAFWYPPGDERNENTSSAPQPQFTGDPRLCPIPRYPESTTPTSPESARPDPAACPANDFTTMNKAASDLSSSAGAAVGFTFIQLAELGVTKRAVGDTDTDVGSDEPPPQLPQALARTDAAIASFVEQYAEAQGSKWGKTVLMVVGSHGYQTTPLANRVPNPKRLDDPVGDEPQNPPKEVDDLSDYVSEVGGGNLVLVPQGTTATIYYKPETSPSPTDAGARIDALRAIRSALLSSDPGSVNEACATLNRALGHCISEVLYVDKDASGADATVDGQHPSWHLDAHDPDSHARTGASGDLVVVLAPGWAVGRAAGMPETQASVATEEQAWSNPYMASSGGPRERAVAALINGPSAPSGTNPVAVRNLDTFAPGANYYPVSGQSVDPSDHNNPPRATDPPCPSAAPSTGSATTNPTAAADFGGLACANNPDDVGDDANDPGHEAQPETVDFAITISALMGVPFDNHPDQLQGRLLQEAFLTKLATPCVEDCEPEEVEEVFDVEPPLPPLPPPPVEVIQEPGFNFHGLVRKLRARVVDSKNRTWRKARRGALMSTIRLVGEFGKPEAAVTLTFYRKRGAKRGRGKRGSRGRSRAARVKLKAIARFDPFAVKRGRVVMRLKIPPQFKPTHIGLTVQEIRRPGAAADGRRSVRCTKVKPKEPLRFRCVGRKAGRIPKVKGAKHLHDRKPRRGSRRRGR